jgi:hypothetical protein
MYGLLSRSLGRGLLRAAGRRCWGCSARPLPGRVGGLELDAVVSPHRVVPRGRGPGLLPLLAGEGRGPGGAGRAEAGPQAGPGDLRALSRSARLVLEARCAGGGGGAAGSGRGRHRGRGRRGRGRDHPAAEASQGEAVQLGEGDPPPSDHGATGGGLGPSRLSLLRPESHSAAVPKAGAHAPRRPFCPDDGTEKAP